MVISNFQRSKGAAGEEEISPRTKRREALFKRESFGSVNSEKIQDRHEWALGEFLEKEKNLTREVLHSSVEPDEAGKVTGDFRLLDKEKISEKDVVEYIKCRCSMMEDGEPFGKRRQDEEGEYGIGR
ncbi:18457_t:CDS:2 [Rhizophagus irregularis]|nr:18457_t:CDS:2 [Rhizophagus irregularis]